MNARIGIVLVVLFAIGCLIVALGYDGTDASEHEEEISSNSAPALEREALLLADPKNAQKKAGINRSEQADALAANATPEDASPRILRRLKGRCLDQHGEPVPHAYVGLATMPGWNMQFIVRADAKGFVELDWPAGLDGTPWLGGALPGYQNQARELASFLKEQKDPESFVFVIPRGEKMHGRVVDEFGNGLADVLVRMDLQSIEPIKTASDGYFYFDAAVPAGAQGLTIHAAGFLVQRAQLNFPLTGELPRFVLYTQRWIRGTVHDEIGKPLSGIRIFGESKQERVFCDSQPDGSFELLERSRADDTAVLRVLPGATEAWTSDPAVPWNSSGISIPLRLPLTLELSVVDLETRQPIEEYGVQLVSAEAELEGQQVLFRGMHKEGILRIEKLLRGSFQIRVHADDKLYYPSAIVPVVIADDVKLQVGVDLQKR